MRRGSPLLLAGIFMIAELSAVLPISAFASGEIQSLRIWIGVEGYDERGEPILTAEAGSHRYEVEAITLADEGPAKGPAADGNGEEAIAIHKSLNTQNTTGTQNAMGTQAVEDSPPRYVCEIELAAEEGRRFAVMKQEDIKLTGIQSTCGKAVRGNAGTSLILTIRLEGLEERLGEIEGSTFTDSGIAVWEEAVHARMYQVQLYYEGKKAGLSHRTDKTEFDFSPLMIKSGAYHYRVTPLSKKGKKGVSLDAAIVRLSDSQGEKNKARWQPYRAGWQTGEAEQSAAGSRQGSIDPDYRYSDGLYPQNTWLELDEIRWRFDSQGRFQEKQEMGNS